MVSPWRARYLVCRLSITCLPFPRLCFPSRMQARDARSKSPAPGNPPPPGVRFVAETELPEPVGGEGVICAESALPQSALGKGGSLSLSANSRCGVDQRGEPATGKVFRRLLSNHFKDTRQHPAGIEVHPFAIRILPGEAPVLFALNPDQLDIQRNRPGHFAVGCTEPESIFSRHSAFQIFWTLSGCIWFP